MPDNDNEAKSRFRRALARTGLACAVAVGMFAGAFTPAVAAPAGSVDLYVTDFQDGGGVYALSPAGGELRTVMRSDESHRPIGIEIVGATAYVAERHSDSYLPGRLVSVPLSGGRPTTVAEVSTPGFVTAIGDTLYVTDSGKFGGTTPRIVAFPTAGGPARVVTEDVSGPLGITSIDSTLYFVDRDASSNSSRIMSVAAGGGTPRSLATLAEPIGITAVGSQLFITHIDPVTGTTNVVLLVPTGGEPRLISEDPMPAQGITAVGNTLYTAGHRETSTDTQGNVTSLPLTGGERTTISTTLTRPADIAADAQTPPCSGSVCINLGDVFGSS